MKKYLIRLLIMTVILCTGGVISINVFAYDTVYNERNEYEMKYNIAYYYDTGDWDGEYSYTKIQSTDELIEQNIAQELHSKYNTMFFENKSLILVRYGTTDPSKILRVVSVTENDNSLEIQIDTNKIEGESSTIDVTCEWIILLEIEKNQSSDGVSIHTTCTIEGEMNMGDINEDGTVDIKDAVFLKQHLLQTSKFSENQRQLADVNHDGIVDEKDAITMEQYLAKWPDVDL